MDDGTPAGTILTNTAQGSSSTTEVLDTDNMDQVTLAVGPDLRVEKELLDEGIRPGHRARYRIRIWNDGHAQARNAVLTDILPTGLTFVGSNWGGDVQGNKVTWNLGDLHPGWNREFEMEVEAARDLPVGSTVTNEVKITNDAGDANPSNNNFKLESTVGSPYRIRVQETHNWVRVKCCRRPDTDRASRTSWRSQAHDRPDAGGDGSFFAGGFAGHRTR